MFSKNIQVTEPRKEKIHYGDSKKKTNTPRVYIRVIRPVKTAVIQRPTTGQSANRERDLGALSLKWDANLLPQGSGIYKEKEAEKL